MSWDFLLNFCKGSSSICAVFTWCTVFCFILQMENTEKRSEETILAVCADMENTLQKLENLSNDMAELASMYHTESNQSVAIS